MEAMPTSHEHALVAAVARFAWPSIDVAANPAFVPKIDLFFFVVFCFFASSHIAPSSLPRMAVKPSLFGYAWPSAIPALVCLQPDILLFLVSFSVDTRGNVHEGCALPAYHEGAAVRFFTSLGCLFVLPRWRNYHPVQGRGALPPPTLSVTLPRFAFQCAPDRVKKKMRRAPLRVWPAPKRFCTDSHQACP